MSSDTKLDVFPATLPILNSLVKYEVLSTLMSDKVVVCTKSKRVQKSCARKVEIRKIM